MTTRFLAPISNGPVTASVFPDSPISYEANAGGIADIADSDFVAAFTEGWIPVGGVGPTSGRAAWLADPAAAAWSAGLPDLQIAPPLFYFDQTLAKLIFYDAVTSTWRDPANGNSV
jgi:hypothetical protein